MKLRLIYLSILTIFLLPACKKDFLDKKPNKALLIPTTLNDFQALLDNSNAVMNIVPLYAMFSTDDIYLADDGFTAAVPQAQNNYIWADDVWQGQSQADWNLPYQQVFYANVVLEGLEKLEETAKPSQQYNEIKGAALFTRAFAFYNLAQEFATAYQGETAGEKHGIPIRLSSNINLKSERGTLKETYQQISKDLLAALPLLPKKAGYKTRPDQSATLAMLARVALTMQDYPLAGSYATSALELNNSLLDYNDLSSTASFPMPNGLTSNPEVLYYAQVIFTPTLTSTLTGVDPVLYESYDEDDLRKTLFFTAEANDLYNFKGNYSGQTDVFGGLANDEIYLTLAESEARAGNTQKAMDALNELLIKRYAKATFKPLVASSPEAALTIILAHRRKELVYRNNRFTDLKRLNLDEDFATTIEHTVKGTTYKLEANSNRYLLPIPADVIRTTDMPQNDR